MDSVRESAKQVETKNAHWLTDNQSRGSSEFLSPGSPQYSTLVSPGIP